MFVVSLLDGGEMNKCNWDECITIFCQMKHILPCGVCECSVPWWSWNEIARSWKITHWLVWFVYSWVTDYNSPYSILYIQVKAQYNILMDGIKQTSFQNLQGDLDNPTETLNGQAGAHQAQQALSFHKVDMEASVMEVSCTLNRGTNTITTERAKYENTVFTFNLHTDNIFWPVSSQFNKIESNLI